MRVSRARGIPRPPLCRAPSAHTVAAAVLDYLTLAKRDQLSAGQ